MTSKGLFETKPANGLALLEAAGLLVVLLPVLLGGIGVVDYIHRQRQIEAAVMAAIYDHSAKVLQWDGLSGHSTKVDQLQLNRTISNLVNATASLLQTEMHPKDLFIEAAFAVVETRGPSGAHPSLGPLQRQFRGSFDFIPEELRDRTDLERAFRGRVTSAAKDQFLFQTGPNDLKPGETTASQSYPKESALLGLRALYREESICSALLEKLFGHATVFYDYRVIALRGEVNL